MSEGTVKSIPFKADAAFVINMLLQMRLDTLNQDDKHTDAESYALYDILYKDPLTDDEIDTIFTRYSDNHGLSGEITIGSEDKQIPEVFGYLFDLPRYKEAYAKHIPYAVVDNQTGDVYPTRQTEHFETMMHIIEDTYEESFFAMTSDEKDAFILNNFTLVGQSRPDNWYVDVISRTSLYRNRSKKKH